MRLGWGARRAQRAGDGVRAWCRSFGWGPSLIALSVAAGLALPPRDTHAGQLTTSPFQAYNAANASAIVAGPFALFTVGLNQISPTQENVGFNEVNKKADGFNLVTTSAGPVSLTTALANLDNSANLLSSIEPVVIGPNGQLYLTDGHHTFRALLDSAYGSSNPSVYVNVIANFSSDTPAQFWAQMEADNLLFPVNDGVFTPVNLSTGSPVPSSILGMTSDPYRGLEYSILKNKSSKLFTTTSNITGAIGSAIPGIDKMTGYYADFINADSYRGANGGLGLPYLSAADTLIATAWDLKGTNTIVTGTANTIPQSPASYASLNGGLGLEVQDLPGYILPTGLATINPGTVTNSSLTNSISNLGAIAADGSFSGLRYMTYSSGGQSVTIGTQQATGVTGPGFLMQLGNDNNTSFATDNDSVTLSAGNTYTGGTTVTAGRLIIMADSSLGAAAGTTVISTSSVTAGVETDNGIVFNSLTEGNGTIQLGSSTSPGTNSFTESRPIAIGGEVATFNLNGNTLTLSSSQSGGQLYSYGALSAGISNAAGESDITINDTSAGATGKLVLGTNANPNFYGNWIITAGTLQASNDASLGATSCPTSAPSCQIGQIELNGGNFQAGASFTSVRSLFLGGGSQYDTNGFSTTWTGTLTDVQRTTLVGNSNVTTPGSVTFGTLAINSTAILGVNAGNVIGTASTTGGAGTTVTLGGITRGGNFANAAPNATLYVNPSVGSTLGLAGTNGVQVFASGAATTLTNGIVPVWIVTDSAGAAATNPYNFLTYSAGNGYQVATYTPTFGASNVVQVASSAAINSSAAYALNVENGKTLTINGGQTLTVGDGTDPAGVILEGTASSIAGGTLAFGASEAVIAVKSTNGISSAVTGTGGLTLSGSGTLNLTSTAGGLSGPINVDSGTLQLSTANFFNTGTTLWLSSVKSKPSNAILTISANETLSGLDTDGNNSAVNIGTSDTLTVGDTTNNWNSTLVATITGTTTGSLVKAGAGLLDLSGSAATFGAGGSVTVSGGALRIGNGIFSTAATTPISVASGAELQYSGNGGSKFNDPITGAGIFHVLAGTVQLTSAGNTYSGGTVIELGATLDVTPANLPTGGNIANSGGFVDFDMANGSASYTGVISDGNEAGGPNDLNDIAGATTNLGAASFAGATCGSNGSSSNPQGSSGAATCLSGNLIKDDSTDNAATSNLTLTQQQQYSGFTAVEAGTLTLAATDTLKNSSGVILGRVGGNQGGGITTQTATLALGANNTITALASNPSSTTTNTNTNVSVTLGGNTLTINPASGTSNTFGGNITDTGTGQLVFSGQGLEIFDGTSMIVNGGTAVTSGKFEVGDGTATGATLTTPTVTVGANGTLLGHGTITAAGGATVTNTAGGVVAPGGTIGTLTVSGSYTQGANSSLAIEVGASQTNLVGQTSLFAVNNTAGPGTASIGGTLAILPDAGTYTRGTAYTILTATGGVTGTFATVTNATPQLAFKPVYNANNVQLLLTGFTPATTSMSGNQSGVFNALNNAPMGSATDSLLNAIGTLSASAQSQALNQLLAFGAAGNASTVTVGMSTFQDAIGGRASADPNAGADVKTAQLVTDDWLPIPTSSTYTVWTQGLGQFSTLHGTSSAPGQSSSVGGGLIGIETATDPSTRLGVSVGAASGSVSVQNMPQSGSINSYALGLYGGRWFGALGFDAEAMGAYNTSSTSRYISLNGLTAKGNTSGFGGGVSGAARYRIATALATVEPQLGLEFNHSGLNSYTETGGGAANLSVGSVAQNSLRSAAGAEIFRAFSDPDGHTIVPEFRAAWLHQFLDTTAHVSEAFAATPTASFSTTGLDVGRDAALLEAGLSYKAPDSSITFYAQYDATLSSREIDHAIRGGFAVFW